MSLGTIISKAVSFVGGVVPSLMDLGSLMDNIKRLIKVGVEKNDVQRIHLACDALDATAGEFGDLQAEMYELSSRLRQAISPDSPGGEDLVLDELLDLADEGADIPEEVQDIINRISELSKAVKAAL